LSLERISLNCSLAIVLRGDVDVRERESSGIISGYVGGKLTCNRNCARGGELDGSLQRDVRGSDLSVSGMTRIRNSTGDISFR
jgi:hypothetical protein